MDGRCENCERVAAELRAKFDHMLDEFLRRIESLVSNIETKNLGLLADVDRNVKRLFDELSESFLQLRPRRMNEGPPRSH
jgi:hypothetical protein